MHLHISRQEKYSRGELLLRSFFGFIYIMLPHAFLLFFAGLWGAILRFLAFWVVLFTGSYPQSWFEYQVGLMRWQLRLNATLYNLVDGYPTFGVDGSSALVTLDVPYPEKISRGLVLVRAFFGVFYVVLPHFFFLYFRLLWGAILNFLAWWIVLFTGSYPESFHEFQVGTLRWNVRVGLYLGYMSDDYPPFSSK